MNLRRWLTVGIGVKRWLLLAFIGLLVLAIGRRPRHPPGHGGRGARRPGPIGGRPGDPPVPAVPAARLLAAGALGLGLFLFGAYRLVRALVDPFALWDRDQPMVEVIYQKRFLARGPRVVAIGGGTGLSALLRGLKEHTSNLTAVVTVADDGGLVGRAARPSSGSRRSATSATASSPSPTPSR